MAEELLDELLLERGGIMLLGREMSPLSDEIDDDDDDDDAVLVEDKDAAQRRRERKLFVRELSASADGVVEDEIANRIKQHWHRG